MGLMARTTTLWRDMHSKCKCQFNEFLWPLALFGGLVKVKVHLGKLSMRVEACQKKYEQSFSVSRPQLKAKSN